MMTAIFVFTTAMLITASIKFIGLVFGNGMIIPWIIPPFGPERHRLCDGITPGHWIIFYPSLMFQIWYWVDNLGVLI